ncbi:MAG: hypothetical protein QM796_11525 [Chthoniobacteraceae bacterium]
MKTLKYGIGVMALCLGLGNSQALWAQGDPSPTAEETKEYPFVLKPELPLDVNTHELGEILGKKEVSEADILKAHRLFTTLSWQAFIALNWPAKPNGQPDRKLTMADNTTWRVWDYWRSAGSIFLKDGARPEPWKDKRYASEKLRNFANMPHSGGNTAARDNFEAFTGPLVDQYGKWARFEIRVNQPEFDYIYKNELYNQDGQVAFSQRSKNNDVDLPINGGGKHGSIEIKLAWKELNAQDDASRFYTTDLTVTPSEPDSKQKTIKVGLVGMHISMRTKSSPEWIWSTFEQIDNVRSNPEGNGKMSKPSFVDPAYTGTDFNVEPPKNAKIDSSGKLVPATGTDATTWIESLTTTPVQVKRIDVPTKPLLNPLDAKLDDVAKALNAEVQAALKSQNSVFQYYELIDTQWPLHPNAQAYSGGAGSAPESLRFKTPGEMIPTFLINTTMETYFQRGDQPAGGSEQDNRLNIPEELLSDKGKALQNEFGGNAFTDVTRVFATESCVGCHYSSGISIGFKKNPDGSEMLNDGYPTAVFGENNHFGKTGGANFSWMLQLEAQPVPRPSHTPTPDAPTAN